MEVPYLERSEIRERARQLCRRGLGSPPPHPTDLEGLLFGYLYEEHGLAFYNDRPLGREDEQDVLGVTYPFDNEIHVDATLAEDGHRGRYRFTVAHEIGHWVLHRPLFLDDCEDSSRDEDTRIVTLERDIVGSQSTYDPAEWQANCFAIWLLLGDDALDRQFRRRFGDPPLTCPSHLSGGRADDAAGVTVDDAVRVFSRALGATPKDGLAPLHEHFLLSIEATAIALEEREYVK